jgi:hypothetical protein
LPLNPWRVLSHSSQREACCSKSSHPRVFHSNAPFNPPMSPFSNQRRWEMSES